MGRASEKRIARIRSLILRTLSDIIRDELHDPRIGMFSLADAQVSKDLSHARILISKIGSEEADECCAVLNNAAPLLRNRLRDETDLRIVPKLVFEIDRGGEYQDEIEELIKKLPTPADTTPKEDDPHQC